MADPIKYFFCASYVGLQQHLPENTHVHRRLASFLHQNLIVVSLNLSHKFQEVDCQTPSCSS
uniref:Uncharacterized protein n=1 Tax=Brassica oleracea TaxID=3712 RepID=A0A3P6CAG1_BRAOL|nr:unnamed protein product [Brassica oleracea]